MGNRNLAHEPIIDLPEYEEVCKDLILRGHPAGWVKEVVDPTYPCATFIKDGKPWYKSPCRHYVGYWLCGGTGSVQCKAVTGLLPGIHHQLFCKSEEGCTKCPYAIQQGEKPHGQN